MKMAQLSAQIGNGYASHGCESHIRIRLIACSLISPKQLVLHAGFPLRLPTQK